MHQAHAAAEDKTVHQGQHRFAVVVDREVEGVFLDKEIFVQGVAAFEAVMQRANVAAGAEGFFPGTAQDHGMDLRILGPGVELAVQVAHHVQGEGIEAGGAVEGQVTNVVANLGQHFVLHGIHGLSPGRKNLSSHH
ncbi:hypothetical protein D3C72_954350 [compost metagenome]